MLVCPSNNMEYLYIMPRIRAFLCCDKLTPPHQIQVPPQINNQAHLVKLLNLFQLNHRALKRSHTHSNLLFSRNHTFVLFCSTIRNSLFSDYLDRIYISFLWYNLQTALHVIDLNKSQICYFNLTFLTEFDKLTYSHIVPLMLVWAFTNLPCINANRATVLQPFNN